MQSFCTAKALAFTHPSFVRWWGIQRVCGKNASPENGAFSEQFPKVLLDHDARAPVRWEAIGLFSAVLFIASHFMLSALLVLQLGETYRLIPLL